MRPLPLLGFLIAALASGCTPGGIVRDHPAGPAEGYPDHSAAEIRQRVEASLAQVRTYRAESRLEASARGSDVDATASLRARLADSLLVVVRGPLNVEGGRALVTRDSLYGYDRINGRLYVGPLAAVEAYVPGAGAEGRLARALLGLEAPPVEAGWTVQPANNLYVLVAPDGRQTWIVDPRVWRVTSVVEVAADGRRLSRQYTQFQAADGVATPRRVVLSSPDDGARLTLEHRSVTINPADLRFAFSPPGDVEIVYVGD